MNRPDDRPTSLDRVDTVDPGTVGDLPTAGDTAPAAPTVTVPGFVLLGELGRGGMGVVYRATHVALGRTVALKMILVGGHASAKQRARFKAEAEAVARLQHPGIVQVFEVGETDGLPWCALEYCPGGSLADRLTAPQPPREAARLVAQLARAVQHAHAHNIVHRDLKPANILLADDGTLKVTDFGLAKRADDADEGMTATGAVMGTPSYMAPEQARGESRSVGPAADVWALGVILFECLAGHRPFRGESPHAVMAKVLADDPPPLPRGVPADLATICRKCLAKEPAGRYASADALADDLRRWLDGEPITARPVGRAERAVKWVRRNPVVATSLLGAVVALTAGATAATVFGLDAREQARLMGIARNEEAAAKGVATKRAEEAVQAQGRAEEQERLKDRQLTRSEWLVYAGRVGNAARALRADDTIEALGQLDLCRWDWRGWEHDYLWTNVHAGQAVLQGHRGFAEGLAWSPDGSRLVSSGSWGEVFIWDARTGERRLCEGHTESVESAAWSPDSTQFVTGSMDNTARLWDADTGECLEVLYGHDALVRAVAFGKHIATAGRDGRVALWDTDARLPVMVLTHKRGVAAVAISPDGRQVLTGCEDKNAYIWNARTGKVLHTLPGHTQSVVAVAWSPDGESVVTGSFDGTVRIWDAESGASLSVVPKVKGYAIYAVAYSPDGRYLATGGSDALVTLRDPRTGRPTRAFAGHTSYVQGIAFRPDGRLVASASGDFTVRVRHVEEDENRVRLPDATKWVHSVDAGPDLVALGCDDGSVWAWNPVTRQASLVRQGKMRVAFVRISPDGQRLFATDTGDKAVLCDFPSGDNPVPVPCDHGWLMSADWTPDGRRLACAGGDGTGFLADAATGQKLLTLKGHEYCINSIRLSPDGTRVVTCSNDRTVRVWDVATGTCTHTLTGHIAEVNGVAFAPDGRRVASASKDKTVRVWPLDGGPAQILRGHAADVKAVVFSPDGRRIASSGDDASVRMWDAVSGQETLALPDHGGRVSGLAFSRDGRRLYSGDKMSMRVWDARVEQHAYRLPGFTNFIDKFGFTPDDRRIAGFTKEGGFLAQWDATTGQEALDGEAQPAPTERPATADGRLRLDATGYGVFVRDARREDRLPALTRERLERWAGEPGKPHAERR